MARRATVIKDERETADYVLLLDAGDSLINDHYPAKSSDGESSIAAYNFLGYDALAIGSLDLTLLNVVTMTERLSEAEFPVLSANVHAAGVDDLLAEPYAIVERGGHQIAILGLTDAAELEGWTIDDPVMAARQWVPKLEEKAGIVIVLSHAGVDTDKRIAAEVPGIDIIISGRGNATDIHTASETGTMLFHADSPSQGQAGRTVGAAYLSFDRAGRLIGHEWRKYLLGEDIEDDQETRSWVIEADRTWR